MIIICRNRERGLRSASRFLLLWMITVPYAAVAESRPDKVAIAEDRNTHLIHAATKAGLGGEPYTHGGDARMRDLKFVHLTTNDGLAQNNIVAVFQDHCGFMWFATGEGLSRYDGNSFVVYKNNPDDPGSLSHNFIRDLVEDDHGYLWVAAHPGVNKFDPTTERSTRYLHNPNNSNSLDSDAVWRITRDSRGYLWLAEDSGLDKFDPATETFTHYRNDNTGHFVGRIDHIIEDSNREIWFVGELGLFHLDVRTGQILRPAASIKDLAAKYMYEDKAGNFWMLAHSPIAGLVKYDRHAERMTEYPLGAGSSELESSTLLDDGENGFWVPSNLGLYYFDRRTEHFTRRFQHDDTNPNSLSDNSVVPIYRDRAGLIWVGTQNGGLNILNFRQEQFGHYTHRPADPDSLSPGTATAIYQEPNGVLWVGLFPRALDRLDRKTGKITHVVPGPENENNLSKGGDLSSICKDTRGYLWIGGWGAGLDRLDERTGQFEHYRHKPDDPHSLMTDNVVSIYGDPSGQLWVGQYGGVSRFDPGANQFINYRLGPDESAGLAYTVSTFHRDHTGTLWLGTWGGVLSRFDDKTKSFVSYPPDQRDPHRLQGGSIGAIHEDRAGRLWLASGLGLYWFDRQNETVTRYTENQGLPSNDLMGILEDAAGRLWISTKSGISRFDPKTETFRNYDVSDGLLSNDFSRSCHQQGQKGEMLYCGSNGVTTFFPENIRDNSYVPPVVIASLKIFNRPVPIGAHSVLKKAIPYVDSLTLSYRDNVFSFEFAALSYANSHKNRYRYKLENFDPSWSEVDSKQRLATYTNLDPGKYVLRVQGSNSDGVWNEQGVSLTIFITPPWWNTTWFRVLCACLVLALLWAAYQWRLRQLRNQFEITLNARVGERTRIARELHDTLLQSFQGLLLQLEVVSQTQLDKPIEAKQRLDRTIERGARAIAEGRDAVQGLRESTIQSNDLARAINALSEELAADPGNHGSPTVRLAVEGEPRDLHPILRDEIYRIAAEAMRNAFRHAHARHIEVEIRYDDQQFRLRVRDDGKGIDPAVLSRQESGGHYGLPGIRERAALIGGKLTVWSEVGAGTEVELRVPAKIAYATTGRRSRSSHDFAEKA
jgi:signal transduction histidine kinase/ligand-binding sensor domain-containing protein